MGRINRGVRCSVLGCEGLAVRSISRERIAASGLKVGGGRRLYLCEAHHKEWKKSTRKERELERLRYT